MTRRLRLLIILAGFCSACGTAPEEPTPVESAVGWIGQARLEGDYTCSDGAYHIVQPITQRYVRPIDKSTNYYTIAFVDDGAPWSVDYARNTVQINCSYKVMAAPVVGSGGALGSTAGALCSVFVRWRGSRDWNYQGYTSASMLAYRPDIGARGDYLLSFNPAVAWGSGQGYGVNGCGTISNQVWFWLRS